MFINSFFLFLGLGVCAAALGFLMGFTNWYAWTADERVIGYLLFASGIAIVSILGGFVLLRRSRGNQ